MTIGQLETALASQCTAMPAWVLVIPVVALFVILVLWQKGYFSGVAGWWQSRYEVDEDDEAYEDEDELSETVPPGRIEALLGEIRQSLERAEAKRQEQIADLQGQLDAINQKVKEIQ